MFDVSTYINRRQKLKAGIDSGIILLMGNDGSPMNYADNIYRFRQDSTFLYYFALNRAGLVGIIDVDQNEHYLFGNEFTIDESLFMGFQPTLSELAEAVGVKETGTISQLENYLEDAVAKGRSIHFLPPYRAENKIKLLHWLGIDPKETQKSASVELIKSIVAQREIKSESVPQRRGQQPRTGGRANQREARQIQADRLGTRTLPDHDVEFEILHRRVENFLYRRGQPVNLVDEQHFVRLEIREDRSQISGSLDGGSTRHADRSAHLVGDDVGERGLAEAWRAVKEQVVECFTAITRRADEHRKVFAQSILADHLVEGGRPEPGLERLFARQRGARKRSDLLARESHFINIRNEPLTSPSRVGSSPSAFAARVSATSACCLE